MKYSCCLKIFLLLLFCGTAVCQWKQINGTDKGNVNCFAIDADSSGSTKIFTAMNGLIYIIYEKGGNWISINPGIPEYLTTLAVGGNNIFAGMCCGRGIFTSGNSGISWVKSDSGLPNNYEVYVLALFEKIIFAGTHNGVYFSTNNGLSWKPGNEGLPEGCSIVALTQCGKHIFAGAAWMGIFTSADSGKSWMKVSTGLPSGFCASALASTGTDIIAGTDRGVYLSTDMGGNWKSANADRLDNAFIFNLTANGGNLFAGAGFGIFLSTDNGTGWDYISSDLPFNTFVTAIVSSSDFIYAGTDGKGVWRRPISELTAVKDPPQILSPAGFILEQNYPNPFNPATTIRYSISAESKVKLSVYNALGKEIKVLVNETLKAGTYKITFKQDEIPSGVYFYRIKAGSYIQTKKMILLH